MNTINKVVLGLVVVVSVVSLYVSFSAPTKVVEVQRPQLGSVTGPDVYFPYVGHNNSRVWVVRQPMNTATTTLCSMKAPSATSTLHWTGFSITTATATAATIDIGTSTSAYATTTNLVAARSIAANGLGNASWSPVGGSVNDSTVSPGVYVNVKTAGAGLGGYTYGGTCTAIFQEF